jgi:hypothetical protein
MNADKRRQIGRKKAQNAQKNTAEEEGRLSSKHSLVLVFFCAFCAFLRPILFLFFLALIGVYLRLISFEGRVWIAGW